MREGALRTYERLGYRGIAESLVLSLDLWRSRGSVVFVGDGPVASPRRATGAAWSSEAPVRSGGALLSAIANR